MNEFWNLISKEAQKRMPKFWIIVGTLLIALVLSACSNDEGTVLPELPQPSDEIEAQSFGWVKCVSGNNHADSWCLGVGLWDGFGHKFNDGSFEREWIMILQLYLKNNGFNPGPQDGLFGTKTLAAVKSFQKARGLKVDGLVGSCTWTSLLHGHTYHGCS